MQRPRGKRYTQKHRWLCLQNRQKKGIPTVTELLTTHTVHQIVNEFPEGIFKKAAYVTMSSAYVCAMPYLIFVICNEAYRSICTDDVAMAMNDSSIQTPGHFFARLSRLALLRLIRSSRGPYRRFSAFITKKPQEPEEQQHTGIAYTKEGQNKDHVSIVEQNKQQTGDKDREDLRNLLQNQEQLLDMVQKIVESVETNVATAINGDLKRKRVEDHNDRSKIQKM